MPYGLVEFNRYFGGTYCLHLQGRTVLAACLAYSLTLKIETLRLSEISVNCCQTSQPQIPKYSRLQSYRCENLKSDIVLLEVCDGG
jgi:hypothetical protein